MSAPHSQPRGFRFLLFAPVLWAMQFLAGYVIASIHCAKFETAEMTGTRAAIAGVVALALVLIAFHGTRGWAIWRQNAPGSPSEPAAERQRFIGFASFLLAIVSGIATIFGALPVLMFQSCA